MKRIIIGSIVVSCMLYGWGYTSNNNSNSNSNNGNSAGYGTTGNTGTTSNTNNSNNNSGGSGGMDCTIKAIDAKESSNANGNKLRTKIVNEDFNFTADAKNSSMGCMSEKYEARYYLINNNGDAVIDEQSFTLNPLGDLVGYNLLRFYDPNDINRSYTSLKVQVKACTEKNGNDYKLYDYSDCDGNECSSDDDTSECIRKFTSSDDFAIRPDHFNIEVDKTQKADVNFSSIIIKAIDGDGNPTTDYNVSSDDIDLIATDKNSSITASDVNYSFTFKDGEAYIKYVKYPEVGDINLTIKEKDGNEYASVDNDDDTNDELKIEQNTTNNFRVVPDHFDLNVTNFSNFKKSKFTYLSRDLNMSAELNVSVIAKNASGNTTKNYAYKYNYVDDLNITISHYKVNSNNLKYILTQYSKTDKDKNITLIYPKKDANFTDGDANLSIMINFDRNQSKGVNSFEFNLSKIHILDSYKDTNTTGDANADINKTLFRYGRLIAENIITYGDSGRIMGRFAYYDNNKWPTNILHNDKKFGDVNETYPQDSDLHEDDIKNGYQKIDVNITSKVRPYKEVVHLGIANWLWYSKEDINYSSPNKDNDDCAIHPCVSVIAKDSSGYWSGLNSGSGYNNADKNTVEVNITKDSNKTIYNKMSW